MSKDMLGHLRRAAAVMVCLSSIAASAHAQGTDVPRLVDNLKNGADFRIRTQAALALGASKNKNAVEPLCSGLSDSNTTVRAAAAAALGKLGMGGKECLSARLGNEPSETVKSAIQKALQQIEGGAEPVIDGSTKYYLLLGKAADKSGRNGESVDQIFRSAFVGAASSSGGVVFAPLSETPEKAKKRLGAFKNVKAFYLAPRFVPFSYAGGSLVVKVEVAVFSYPGKALIGSFSKNLTMSGVSEGDTGSEDELLKMLGEKVFKQFTSSFQ